MLRPLRSPLFRAIGLTVFCLAAGCSSAPGEATSTLAGEAAPAQALQAAAAVKQGRSGLTEIQFSQFFTPSKEGSGQVTPLMNDLNGKKVGIRGYMTELTPIDNRFIYLVPTAGAICPFCSADNPRYLEAIAVYLPKNKKFEFTKENVWAYGTLEVGEETDQATGLISMFRLKADDMEVYQPR